jgi:hypothetical protein
MAGNPTDELTGLASHIGQACVGVISRTVTVLNRDYDGYWPGPWPLVLLRLADYSIERIAGGQTGLKGQQGTRQNYYAVEIHDVIDPRAEQGSLVADSETDLYALVGAIVSWFDTLSHQQLQVDGSAQCVRAGEYIRFRMQRPFMNVDGGEVRVVLAGLISVLGAPHAGIDA